MKLLKAVIVIALSLGAVLLAQRYFGKARRPAHRSRGGEPLVNVTTAAKRHFANRIEAVGTAQANESISITSTVAERIAKILFEGGAVVEEGAVLVRLEDAEEQAQREEARIALAEQRREFARLKDLREKKIVSEQEFDTQLSNVQAAEARLAAAEARLRDRAISAPFPGVLGLRRVSPGAFVNPGTLITTLDDLRVVKAEFSVPETYLAELQVGQTVRALCAAWPDEPFEGSVTCIDSRVDPATRAVTVQARIPNPALRLRTGMLLTIELISRPRDAVGIPEKALLSFAEKQYVYILGADRTVTRRAVRLGRRDAGWVEIEDGIAPGETVVTEGLMDLRDGARVRVVSPDDPALSRRTPASTLFAE